MWALRRRWNYFFTQTDDQIESKLDILADSLNVEMDDK